MYVYQHLAMKGGVDSGVPDSPRIFLNYMGFRRLFFIQNFTLIMNLTVVLIHTSNINQGVLCRFNQILKYK